MCTLYLYYSIINLKYLQKIF